MKATRALTLLALTLSGTVFAQYSVEWWKVAGGGGVSTGGVFAVQATIGQPDAGALMTNRQYSVTGGCWASPTAAQTPNAPLLTIRPAAPGWVTISWLPASAGFVLQATDALSPTNWLIAASGTNNPVTLPVSGPARFYRLVRQ